MAKGTMRPAKEKRKPKAEKNKKPKGGAAAPAVLSAKPAAKK
jgi:hypothetical protein